MPIRRVTLLILIGGLLALLTNTPAMGKGGSITPLFLPECRACHRPPSHSIHKNKGLECLECHAVHGRAKDKDISCATCHYSRETGRHTESCALCHEDITFEEYVGKGPKIHKKHMDKVACGVCHAIPETTDLEPTGQYCRICHGAEDYDWRKLPGIHKKHVEESEVVPYMCEACHGFTLPAHEPKDCGRCHRDEDFYRDWGFDRHRKHAKEFDCTGCHQEPALFDFPRDTACQRCHGSMMGSYGGYGGYDGGHYGGYDRSHDRDYGGYSGYSGSYGDRFRVHKKHFGKAQCWACHASDQGIFDLTADGGCLNCHDRAPEAKPFYKIHKKHAGKAYPCWVCHGVIYPRYIAND